jgi:peptidoglycan/xylan/chitin deacetylase (PgdA/CDA1 family)
MRQMQGLRLGAVALTLLLGASQLGPVRPGGQAVPILMYHVIASPPAGAPYPGLYVPRPDFAAEVAWLAGHGYRAVTLEQVFAAWRGSAPLPRRPIVFSFDDGYRSVFTNAFPVLGARRWRGDVNLEVADTKPSWGLRPRMVRTLIAAGWELDSHTITHPDLTRVDQARLQTEVAGSRKLLRREFHVPVDFFCYPSGRFDAAVVAEVKAAGYLGATTTLYGLGRPSAPYTLDRIRVDGSDGVRGLVANLAALGLHR